MTTLADDLLPDELWALVKPLLPAPPRPPYGGRQHTISDRAYPAEIAYMSRTSTPVGCCQPASLLWLPGDLLAPPDRVGQREVPTLIVAADADMAPAEPLCRGLPAARRRPSRRWLDG